MFSYGPAGAIPGALVQLSGVYDLDADSLDFHGTLHMQAKISETTTGCKDACAKRTIFAHAESPTPHREPCAFCSLYRSVNFPILAFTNFIAPSTSAGSSRSIAKYFFNNSRGGASNPFLNKAI